MQKEKHDTMQNDQMYIYIKKTRTACMHTYKGTYNGLADLYSSVSESSSDEYCVSPLPPASNPCHQQSRSIAITSVLHQIIHWWSTRENDVQNNYWLACSILNYYFVKQWKFKPMPTKMSFKTLYKLLEILNKQNSHRSPCRAQRETQRPPVSLPYLCVMRRTSLFRTVQPISGLSFTSFKGGSTCTTANQKKTFNQQIKITFPSMKVYNPLPSPQAIPELFIHWKRFGDI